MCDQRRQLAVVAFARRLSLGNCNRAGVPTGGANSSGYYKHAAGQLLRALMSLSYMVAFLQYLAQQCMTVLAF